MTQALIEELMRLLNVTTVNELMAVLRAILGKS